jgi:hypothetical protein
MNIGPRRGEGRGGRIRAREAKNLMTRGDQLSDDGGADKTGGAGDKDTHGEILHVLP